MNKKFSNLLRIVTFSVKPSNQLSYYSYPTNNFTRIDSMQLNQNINQYGMKKVIIVFITDYDVTSNFIKISDNLAITTISFREFLEDDTSINLLFNYKDEKNIVFIFKDLNWLHVEAKFRDSGYTLVEPELKRTKSYIKFHSFLDCIDRLIGYSIRDSWEETQWLIEFLEYFEKEYFPADTLSPDKDLSTESILIFDKNKSIINYNNIDEKIDDFLN
jgi:hypothetical protein